MNFWPRWINAIKKRTATLSLMQMGAYDRLLDHYYAEEKPLPGTRDECYRIVSATSKAEQEAVRAVLDKYFVLRDGFYWNERADEEIAIGLKKIAAAQANGKTGGRPRGSTKKPSGLPAGNPTGTQRAGHEEPAAKAPHPYPQKDSTEDYPDLAGGRVDDPDLLVEGFTPTAAGLACKAMKAAGIADVNPGHPTLLKLLESGATLDEIKSAAEASAGKGNRFAYTLTVLANQRERAAKLVLHQGDLPAPETAGQRAARARIEAAVPDLAAHRTAAPKPINAEVFDVPARLLG